MLIHHQRLRYPLIYRTNTKYNILDIILIEYNRCLSLSTIKYYLNPPRIIISTLIMNTAFDERIGKYQTLMTDLLKPISHTQFSTQLNPHLQKAKEALLIFRFHADKYLEEKEKNPFQTLFNYESSEKVVEKYEEQSHALYHHKEQQKTKEPIYYHKNKPAKKTLSNDLKKALISQDSPSKLFAGVSPKIDLKIASLDKEEPSFNIDFTTQTAGPETIQINLKNQSVGSLFSKPKPSQSSPAPPTLNIFTKLEEKVESSQQTPCEQKIQVQTAAPGSSPDPQPIDQVSKLWYQSFGRIISDALDEDQCEQMSLTIKSYHLGSKVKTSKLLKIFEILKHIWNKLVNNKPTETVLDQKLWVFGKEVHDYLDINRKAKMDLVELYLEGHKDFPPEIKTTMNADMRFIIKSLRNYRNDS